jgi:hypothetical protein
MHLGAVILSVRQLWLRMEVRKMDFIYIVIKEGLFKFWSSRKIIQLSPFLTVRHRYIYVSRYRWQHNLCSVEYGISELGIDISNPAAIGSYADGFDISNKYGDCALVETWG